MAASKRVCAVCGGGYTGTAHGHAPAGMPPSVRNAGPSYPPRPMVGNPPMQQPLKRTSRRKGT